MAIGGPTWQKTFSALPPDLLPVKANGLVSLESLEALAELGGEPIKDAGPWLVSQATLTDGNLVVEQDGVPLIAAARRGSGTVLYLAMDPTVEPLRSWAGTPRLWRYVLAHGAGGVGLTSAVSSTFTGWGRIPRNAMVDISALSGPTPGLMMLALAVFAAVVGPLNYLFLLRFGRPGWSVVTIPLITGLAAIGTFTLAGAFRDSDVIVSKVGLVRGYPNAPAYGRTYVSVLSRRPASLSIRGTDTALINSLFHPFPRDPAPDAQGWALKVVEGIAPSVEAMELPAGSLGTFTVDSQVNLPGKLDDRSPRSRGARSSGRSPTAWTSNLNDASLIVDYQVLRLGDIRKGETREIAMTLTGNASAGFGPPTSFSSLLYPGPAGTAAVWPTAPGATSWTRRSAPGSTSRAWTSPARRSSAGSTRRPRRSTWSTCSPATVDTTLLVSSLPLDAPEGVRGRAAAPGDPAPAAWRHDPEPPAVRQLRPRRPASRSPSSSRSRPAPASCCWTGCTSTSTVGCAASRGRPRSSARSRCTTGSGPSGRIGSSGSGGTWCATSRRTSRRPAIFASATRSRPRQTPARPASASLAST